MRKLSLQLRLKYQDLYYKYRQKVDLLKVLKQQEDQPPASEASVLTDFFAFLRARDVGGDNQVVVVANSTELLPLLQSKAPPQDLAMIAGEMVLYCRRSGCWLKINMGCIVR